MCGAEDRSVERGFHVVNTASDRVEEYQAAHRSPEFLHAGPDAGRQEFPNRPALYSVVLEANADAGITSTRRRTVVTSDVEKRTIVDMVGFDRGPRRHDRWNPN